MAGPETGKTYSKWINVPFSPRALPFFYGWVILAGATLGTLASIPGQTIGVGVFTDKLIGVLNLSRTELSLAYMFGTVASSFLLPFAGSATDRFGCRVMITISAICMGASLLLISQAGIITKLFGSAVMVIACMAVLFLLIRFFGQGCLTIVSRVCISKWFNHRRGMATGISNVFIAFLFSASPAVLNYIVERFGWSMSYILLGIITGVGMTVIGWLIFRDNPEQCGLVMDGRDDQQWLWRMAERIPETVKEFTRREALGTLAFWSFSTALAWQALFMTAVTFHITSMGKGAGLDRDQSYAVFPVIGFISLFVTLGGGWLSDRVKLKKLLIANIICITVAAAGLLNFSEPLGRWLFCGGYGTAAGFFGLLLTVTWPRYFGREHVGAINGLTSSILVFASAAGPILFSWMKDITGDFQSVIVFSIALPLALLLPAFKTTNPQSALRQVPPGKK